MDSINDIRAAITVASFLVFIGICVWAWSGKRKSRFDDAVRLVQDDDDRLQQPRTQGIDR